MTPEQEHEFCRAASLGITLLGPRSSHYEWFVQALRLLTHGPYTEIESSERKITASFVAFERTLCDSPDEEDFYKNMTVEQFYTRVNNFYERGNKNA